MKGTAPLEIICESAPQRTGQPKEHKMDATAQAIQNQLDISIAVQTVITTANGSRPKSTRKNYNSKQVKWIRSCEGRLFINASLVLEGELLLIVNEVVVVRGNRTKTAHIPSSSKSYTRAQSIATQSTTSSRRSTRQIAELQIPLFLRWYTILLILGRILRTFESTCSSIRYKYVTIFV